MTETKRQTVAQILICSGCCCGRVDKGRPAVPVDWLKGIWKERRLRKEVQLTIAGCLGPCDIANVVCIVMADRQVWLGGLTEQWQYEALLEWGTDVAESGLVPLPASLLPLAFERFLPQDA